ncbi:MAG: N-acetyltransferase [Streptococcus sp.]|nr:MAG: N-acetyltransferase [Streptococcus sp.]
MAGAIFCRKRGRKMEQVRLPDRLETERLVLRVRTVADAVDIFDYASRPEVSYPAGFPPVQTLEDEIYYLEHILPERNQKENLPAGYGIVVKGTDKIVGSVDFNHRHEDDVLEIGYILHPDYWGRGYVSEAARALIDLAFKELNLHKIELSCFGYNLQSQRVAEKLGFTLEARIRDRKDAQGNRCDDLRYGLLKSEWEVRSC